MSSQLNANIHLSKIPSMRLVDPCPHLQLGSDTCEKPTGAHPTTTEFNSKTPCAIIIKDG